MDGSLTPIKSKKKIDVPLRPPASCGPQCPDIRPKGLPQLVAVCCLLELLFSSCRRQVMMSCLCNQVLGTPAALTDRNSVPDWLKGDTCSSHGLRFTLVQRETWSLSCNGIPFYCQKQPNTLNTHEECKLIYMYFGPPNSSHLSSNGQN